MESITLAGNLIASMKMILITLWILMKECRNTYRLDLFRGLIMVTFAAFAKCLVMGPRRTYYTIITFESGWN